MPRTLIVGPVQHDPDEDGLAGMGWFVPYFDSEEVAGPMHFSTTERWATRDHAIEARDRLLRRKGAVRLDDVGVFHAVAAIVRAAKGK